MEASTSAVILQLAVVLVAAKLGAEVAVRWMRQPPVIGELLAGVLIGPYALGSLVLPGAEGPVFLLDAGGPSAAPVSAALMLFTQVGAAVLLFDAGLQTDLHQFARRGLQATVVAIGGVLLPFGLVAVAVVLLGLAPSVTSPGALFMGAVVTATSVGITARVLTDLQKLQTAEGVTIVGAAVVDDVLGILVLAIVTGVLTTGSVSLAEVSWYAARALGFWVAMVAFMVVAGDAMSAFLLRLHSEGAVLGLGLALALFAGVAAEHAGLAFIIGAYSAGLGLSRTPVAPQLSASLQPVAHAVVPVFFVVMGMLVNVPLLVGVAGAGLVLGALAAFGKIAGCGLPALLAGFRPASALQVGIGMLPRGEVALIVAGAGLTSGMIDTQLFGAAVFVTVLTTLPAPKLLAWAFSR